MICYFDNNIIQKTKKTKKLISQLNVLGPNIHLQYSACGETYDMLFILTYLYIQHNEKGHNGGS